MSEENRPTKEEIKRACDEVTAELFFLNYDEFERIYLERTLGIYDDPMRWSAECDFPDESPILE